MFDIGWTELLVIGVVALIVVGPKDLPMMFRTLGRFTGKMKGMAREFQRAMDQAADESGVKDVAKDLRKATSAKSMGLDALNNAADRFEKWQPGQKSGEKPGPGVAETSEISEERAASAEKFRQAAADSATTRKAAESAAAPDTTAGLPEPQTGPATVATPAPKGDA